MTLYSKDAIERTFLALRSKNDDTRLRSSYDLLHLVTVASKELPPEKFQECYDVVLRNINILLAQNTETWEKLGGILAIEQLIAFDVKRTSRILNPLNTALRSNDNTVLLFAARALGHLAVPGGALTAQLVETEVRDALEWLQLDRQENRRFASVLIIRELAKNSPTLFYSFVPQVSDCIWIALRDPKVMIRETAAEAAGACFEIIAARDASMRKQWFDKIYEESQMNIKSTNADHVHGALLVVKELLLRGGMYMRDHYKDACDNALRLKDYREPRIRALVVNVIPILAGYAPELFAQSYLHKFMIFLQGQLKKDKDRNDAFVAIGKIAHAVGSAIAPYLDAIIVFVREGLSVKARNRLGVNETPVFQCISMLSVAVGMALTKYMEAILDPMFACGLSPALTQALMDMASYIQPIKPQIREKLLDLLSLVLSGKPFRPLGCPNDKHLPLPAFAKDLNYNNADHKESDIVLALTTLGTFEFETALNEFVRDVAMQYTDNNSSQIRKAAALTCCQLYVKDPIVKQTSFHAIRVVSDVLGKLLNVGIADPDPSIRRTVLEALHSNFDRHLSKPENIRTLFLAVNDSDLEVREAAVVIIGRLTEINPAHVFPSLRKLLVNLITGIRNSNDPKHAEDGAKLIGLVISNASKLVRPYCSSLVDVLAPKAMDPNPMVATTTIVAIGQLATVGGMDLVKYIPRIMTSIMHALHDHGSPVKRDAALHTLGQIASNCAYVIQPYSDFPELLDLLIGIVKTEPQGPLRKETIKLLGILGALDPFKAQQIRQNAQLRGLPENDTSNSDVSLIIGGLSPQQDEYYPKVVFMTLMNNVLQDPALATHHSSVIEAIVSIFKALGLRCIPFLSEIIPTFVSVIKATSGAYVETYFNQLSVLVTIVRVHIRNYVGQLLDLISHFWTLDHYPAYSLLAPILSLIESLSRALGSEFRGRVTRLLPLMLDVIRNDTSVRRQPSERILQIIIVFGQSAEEHMHLILPALIDIFQSQAHPLNIRKLALESIGRLCRQVNISDFASMVIHSFLEVFAGRESGMKNTALECLCTFITQLGQDFLLYEKNVEKALVSNHVPHHNYDALVNKLKKGEPLPQDLSPDDGYGGAEEVQPSDVNQSKLKLNMEHLKNAWEASHQSTREDWAEWMRRFSLELLKESPSHALRACATLANNHTPLAKDLFNSAFASCWTELYEQYQEDLMKSLDIAISSPQIPPDILQILLNLCEFMEHDDRALPQDIRTLGRFAAKNHAYAKALHYKELEFEEEKTPSTVEALITINNHLQQSDAAVGILRNAQKYRDFELKESWYEKLHRWDEALEAYERREKDDPASFEATMGRMRCLHALGEWETLSGVAEQKWSLASIDHKRAMAPLAAASAWGLGHWQHMDNYLDGMKNHLPDKSFFSAISSIHRFSFSEASIHIERAREGLDTELSALLGESYSRAYSVLVRIQMLAELEEIMTYRMNEAHPEKQEALRLTWTRRLKGCQKNVEVWQRMLKVRTLVLGKAQNTEMWIKFANLCRKSGRKGLAEQNLRQLHEVSNQIEASSRHLLANGATTPSKNFFGVPEIMYAAIKYTWSIGDRQNSLRRLGGFTDSLVQQLNTVISSMKDNTNQGPGNYLTTASNPAGGSQQPSNVASVRKLLAKSYVKQGKWLTELMYPGDWSQENVRNIIGAYTKAKDYSQDWYKAWHAWAIANFDVAMSTTSKARIDNVPIPAALIPNHVVPAIQGFIKSVALTEASSLQDALRLLTLWFAHGSHPEVNTAVLEGFSDVSIDVWLEVIPQLIARISQQDKQVRATIHRLLTEIGKAHPQALVYPLTVTMKSSVTRRSQSAASIMEKLREHSPSLVEQADVVAHELIRVAVSWHELWHEALEEASRLFFGDDDVEGMFATLEPLHKMLEKGAETLREMSFNQTFGKDLANAHQFCQIYKTTGEKGDLNQAWDIYYMVFRRISKQLPSMLTIDLEYVSPKLFKAKTLDLAVPGTYKSGQPVIRIMSFNASVAIINSKQRPRKLTIRGSDGKDYEFCLKGHEDIRQDERVMQLFGLINTLLSHDGESFKRHLNIQPYPAIPLSQQSGLLGWVPNSETMHNLIKDYREQRRILLNIEHRIMLQMAPDFDNLTLMQKVEVFSYAMDNTTGKDLYRVLWLKSRSSESWLDRRTNYTRSLATMSMVGYILGLGDRHPSNLLVDKYTGQVVHIDFGDCFEVAMHRDKYPERVPFRLTRMLTYAMEVSNIDGSYKISSEAVMRVIRDNKESLMAVLEAFIHDPLLNWRLGKNENAPEPSFHSERRASIAATNPVDAENAGQFAVGKPSSGGAKGGRRLSALHGGMLDAQLESGSSGQREDQQALVESQNARAVQVIERVRDKLTGKDFRSREELGVERQVAKLIAQATNVENLCQHYIGWCSFW